MVSSELERWLKVREQTPLAIVFGSSANGLSFARSLGRRGISVLLLDSERLLGAFTRYSKFVLLPPVDQSPQDWLALIEFVGAHAKHPPFLFITTDAHTLFVAQHEQRLVRSFRFIIPDLETVERILNKRSQYQIASGLLIPIPATLFPDRIEEVRNLLQGLDFPCLLKPCVSHTARKRLAKRKLVVVNSSAELLSTYEQLASADLQLMIQEIVPGNDDAIYGYLGFWDSHSLERVWLTFRKLRQYPPSYGDGSLIETTEAQQVAEYSRRLLRGFHYRGFVEVEFKLDARDHTLRLLEINPRSTSFNELAVGSGIDFPWIGYEYLAGREQACVNVGRSRLGVRYVDEELDFQAFRTLTRAGKLGFGAWVRSIFRARPIIFAWDDPMPIVNGLWRLLRNLVQGNRIV